MVVHYKFLYLAVFLLVTFCVGAACILFPHQIQSYAKRAADRGVTRKLPALRRFVSSRPYLLNVRLVGSIALLMSAAAAWTLFIAS